MLTGVFKFQIQYRHESCLWLVSWITTFLNLYDSFVWGKTEIEVAYNLSPPVSCYIEKKNYDILSYDYDIMSNLSFYAYTFLFPNFQFL